MKKFLGSDFLLESPVAQELFDRFAKNTPVIDYHNHLSPADIADNRQFNTITEVWLGGDHYKWRAMRANGIAEDRITGAATDADKFNAWAETVPYTMRNPLYHWTHLELQRYFGISDLLDETNGQQVYEHCNRLLQQKEFSVLGLLEKMNVRVVCTTDDPCDSLEHHHRFRKSGHSLRMLPAFRPDNGIAVEHLERWLDYVQKLEKVSGQRITKYADFMTAFRMRHDYFSEAGGCISDHGCESMVAGEFSAKQQTALFEKLRAGHALTSDEIASFKTGVLYELAILDHEKGWVQQWHVGAIRNNNTRLLKKLGADAGVDSIGDFETARTMAAFFDRLDTTAQLAKTIVYNLNPADSEVYATMMGNFQDGSVAGKMQYGAAWWFLDQKDGIERQLQVLSNMGLISRFVGMLTDSRSFLSFPRHEYFRRILCNVIGQDIVKGELPANLDRVGKMVEDICYNNAKSYFNF